MPFIAHTPESLIPRSDSKNPASTCKGITSSGRPCRRTLAASPRTSPQASSLSRNGVLAVVGIDDGNHQDAAAFFCWQHKEQAAPLIDGPANRTRIVELRERSSSDTLVDRLGVLDVWDEEQTPTKKKPSHYRLPPKRKTMPKQWQNIPGPLMSVPEDATSEPSRIPKLRPQPRRKPRSESNLLLSLFCCVRADPESVQAPRIRHDGRDESRRLAGTVGSEHTVPMASQKVSRPPRHTAFSTDEHRLSSKHGTSPTLDPHQRQNLVAIAETHYSRPALPQDPSSQTQNLLSLIPQTLSPQTTSLLLAELAKPISDFDQDSGYIYMFWLTDTASATPEPRVASSLLAPPIERPSLGRRTSEQLQEFASSSSTSTTSAKKTILLKIGRASNVQRRMNEWTRQCNYNLSLIRYYPYHPTSPSPSPTGTPSRHDLPPTPPHTPRKVPHAHRVERLIHLELAERRVKRLCAGCSKEHREWFEVHATRDGVKGVDEVIKRWVGWAEGKGLRP